MDNKNWSFHLSVTLMILIQSIFMKIYSSLYKITNCCVKYPINVGPPFITFKNSLILSLLIQNKDVQRMWFGEVRVCSWVNIFPAESLFTWESCTNPIINIVHLFTDPYKLPCFVEWSLKYFLFQHLLSLEVWKWCHERLAKYSSTATKKVIALFMFLSL